MSPRIAILLLASTFFFVEPSQSQNLPVAGRVERARLSPGDIELGAKLDTGARTSSLHAVNLVRFTRDGRDWVAFDIEGTDGRSNRIERAIVRMARIKNSIGVDEERPVITLGICVGRVYRITEVNLVDRSDLAAPLLIGRRFINGRLVVNPNRSHLLEPTCKSTPAP